MKNIQFSLIGLLVCFSLHLASGQQVYNANDYGGPGTVYLYNDLFGFQPDTILTNGGADITWDLSSFTNTRTHPEKIVAKEAAFDFFTFLTICALGGNNALDCANIWNNTDQAWLVTDTVSLFQFSLTDLQRYQTISNSSLLENFLGFNAHLGTMNVAAVVVYQNPDTILHFPVVYGDHFTSSTAWTIDLAPAGQNVKYTSHQQRETSIDAWGDIITPNQNFNNVVRMRSLVHRQDTLVTDTMTIPLNLTQVEYMWFDTAYKLPVMVVNGRQLDSSVMLNRVEYLWDKTCAAPTWTATLDSDTYTIDSTGSVTITFTINNSNADEYTWDWGDGQFTTTTGTTTHTFTEPGAYSVGITGCMTNCLPMNSCTSDILDFVILSTDPVPGDQVGLKIYPNPLSDRCKLFIPESLGNPTYRIFNLNGSLMKAGKLGRGLNDLSLPGWSEGMYAMEVHANQKDFVVRFVIIK